MSSPSHSLYQVRPPRRSRASISVQSSPAMVSSRAAATPANPPPMTIASSTRGVYRLLTDESGRAWIASSAMEGHGINDTARALFAPLGGDYDRWATILSFAQDPRWRRFLVEHVPVGTDARVLDVATGTGAIARALVRRYGCRVVGIDQSPEMLEGARERIGQAGLADRIELRLGSAEELDFAEVSFDALTAGYLLRYLEHP